MVGQSHRAQIRHIVVASEEVAKMIREVVEAAKTHTAKVQTLMKLAPKYSLCESKADGGNLGWLELVSDDPRKVEYAQVFRNRELETLVREAIRNRELMQNRVLGPVKTAEGFHVVMIGNEFGANIHETF